jgi:peptidoglycan pentaglycine glycine transferase (the first glycine)
MNVYSKDTVSDAEWDRYVSASPQAHFMQSYAWGALQRNSGWEPHYLMFMDGETVLGAVLLLSRSLPLLGKRIFYAPRGPVADFSGKETLPVLARELRLFLAREQGVFLRIDPYRADTGASALMFEHAGFVKVPRDWSYWNAPRLVLWLDLRTDEDTLFKNMSSTCRNEVRSGYKKGVEFSLGSAADLDDFHRLMISTGQHKGIAVHDSAYYRRLYETLNRSAKAELFLGRFEGKIIAGGISVKYGDKGWLLYAASDREYYKLRPNRTLQWEMIKWAHAEGCSRYDFRGTATSDPPSTDDPGYGVYEFKKSFGPEFTRLAGYYDLVTHPFLYRMFRFAEEKLLPIAYRTKTWLDERRGV